MALEGTFEDMSLTDLFQIFQIGAKSGILVLHGASHHGVVYVSTGRLIDAVIVKSPERTVLAVGEDAVITLLQWPEASFVFRHDLAVSNRPVRILHDSEWLVVESFRRQQTPAAPSAYQHLTPASYFQLAAISPTTEQHVHLDLEQWRLLSYMATAQQGHDLAEQLCQSFDKLLPILNELVAIGLVEVVAPVLHHPPIARSATTPSTNPVASNGNGRGLLHAIRRRIRSL